MIDDGLARLAANPGLAGLWADVHDRWCELGGCRGSVAVRDGEYDAVRRLLGLTDPPGQLRLTRLAGGLHGEERLAKVLTSAVGPLEDRRTAREQDRRQRAQARDGRLRDWLEALPASLADTVTDEHARRPKGLPDLLAGVRAAVARATSGQPHTWATFTDLAVTPASAAWRTAEQLLGGDLAGRASLCQYEAEAVARRGSAHERVIAHCAQAGGRQPIIAVDGDDLDALIALLDDLCAWASDPPDGGARLSVLANERFADPHALDRGQPCGQVCARLLADLAEIGPVRSVEDWRAAWTAAGVEVDGVSSRVLVFGLRPAADTSSGLAAMLRAADDAGLEESLSVRQLADGLPEVTVSRALVVENPPVFEDLLSEAPVECALVCSMGKPRLACLRLVRDLVAQGVQVVVSADDDHGGQVTRQMLVRQGATALAPEGRYEEEQVARLAAWMRAGA